MRLSLRARILSDHSSESNMTVDDERRIREIVREELETGRVPVPCDENGVPWHRAKMADSLSCLALLAGAENSDTGRPAKFVP
jgi:hypothetical protein